MATTNGSDNRARSTKHEASSRRRRISLLGAIALSVGAASPSMLAGDVTAELTRPLMPAMADRISGWTSALMHGRSFETAGLFLMGFSLIVAGRLLTRSDQKTNDVRPQAPGDELEAPVQRRMSIVRTSDRRAG